MHIFGVSGDGALLQSPKVCSKQELAPYGALRENFQKSVALLTEVPVAHHLSLKVISFNLGTLKCFDKVIHVFV